MLEFWWTWSGSNRRPLPYHFSSSIVAERHCKSVSDNEGQCSCASGASSLPLSCIRTTVNESTRCGRGCDGYDTNRDTADDAVHSFPGFGPAHLGARTPQRPRMRRDASSKIGQCPKLTPAGGSGQVVQANECRQGIDPFRLLDNQKQFTLRTPISSTPVKMKTDDHPLGKPIR